MIKTKSGFTLVELLIVIVVIAILASISIVSYSGIQDRASDTKMRSGISQIEKAIQMWHAEYGELPRGGWGSTTTVGPTNCVNGSGGWFASGTYTCAYEDALIATGHLPADFASKLPNNPAFSSTASGRYATMFYACGGATNTWALFYHLRRPTAEDASRIAQAESLGCGTSPRTSYHMNSAAIVRL